jgi:uncharacterized protein
MIALCLAGALALAAETPQTLTSIPNPRVINGTWVSDAAGALRPDTVAQLNTAISAFEQATGAEMAVVVIRSLDGMSVEEAAVKLFQLWGIGKKNKDNGLLLLWSTGDRRVRVEVGYGLEGIVPDGKAGAILDAYVIPRFKKNEFDEGIQAGVDALIRAARSEAVDLPSKATGFYEAPTSSPASAPASPRIWPTVLGFLAAIPAGIGSIVGVRRWRRYRRRRCPQCGSAMTRLDEAADDALLEQGQRAEERVGSVDYDVWSCPSCSHHLTVRYPKWLSGYDECPQCHNRTKSSSETVIHAATTHTTGSNRVKETCAFCSFRHEYTKVIPQLPSPSSSTSSSGSDSSGSSGGGSSFGGGSSGGGGASRGY